MDSPTLTLLNVLNTKYVIPNTAEPVYSWYVLAQKWPGIWPHFPVRGPGGGIRVHYSAQIAVEEGSRDPDYVLDISSLLCDRGM